MSAAVPERITCLSLHQPYAGLVACGLKTLETRPRPWPKTRPFPATVLICAAAKMDGVAMQRLLHRIPAASLPLCERGGVALAMVEVTGCRPLTAEDEPRSWFWDPEEMHGGFVRYAYELANVRRVVPFPVSGLQGFGRSIPMAIAEEAARHWTMVTG